MALGQFAGGGGGGGSLASSVLNDLGDVTITSVQTNDVLCWNGTAWVNCASSLKIVSFEGICQNTTASFSLDTPTANAPAAACVTGANIVNRAVLDFDPSTDETVYGSFLLPTSLVAMDLYVEAHANEAGTNVARLSIAGVCVGTSETFDPAFNTAQTFAWTNTGSNQRVVAVQTDLTLTGCVPGERYYFKFFRDADGTSGTDSVAVDLRVVSLRFVAR